MSISMLSFFGSTIAAIVAAAPATATNGPAPTDPVQSVQETYARANAALMRGDVETYNSLVPLTEDFVLMSPMGGEPSRYADYTPETFERMVRFFRNGDFSQELVESYAAEDMIVLVTIERTNAEVGGLPAQDWALRVTSVFTRDGSQWKLAHRHADPLVEDVSLEESARLGRGERMTASK